MAKTFGAPPKSGGKLYFTEFNTHIPRHDVTAFGDRWVNYIDGLGQIEFSGVMPMTEGSYALMNAALSGKGFDFFQERREWLCTWCGSPNPIEHRHCSQCGGPRGWIL